jgi:hypothetical protein
VRKMEDGWGRSSGEVRREGRAMPNDQGRWKEEGKEEEVRLSIGEGEMIYPNSGWSELHRVSLKPSQGSSVAVAIQRGNAMTVLAWYDNIVMGRTGEGSSRAGRTAA